MAHAVSRSVFLRRGNVLRRGIADDAPPGAARSLPLRAWVIAACALGIGAAAWFGNPGGYLHADPALARLLRGMALIKSAMVLAAVGAVVWRFGFPVAKPVAVVYIVGCCVLAGSTTLIWQLTLIPLAAILFHAAALGMLIVGWRDR